MKKEDRKRVSSELKSWLDDVSAYEREFKKWEGRVEKIIKRYRDDFRTGSRGYSEAKFNILWANVQTLVSSTFARVPKPDVSRRFKDNDPVGRVASLILERDLDYHVQHYPMYREALKACVHDRFLGGRGTSWVRYEPHFRAVNEPVDGLQVTEDVDEGYEQLDYECVAVDYVHWKDFGHSVARTWEEVNRVWRKVYMTKEALVERFGEDVAKLIPMDASVAEGSVTETDNSQLKDAKERACIYEGWDKSKKVAVWFSKGVKDFLDEKEDPLGVEEFFPCPKPIYSTLTSDSLVPVPDFTLYQDQANELDILADRIDGLVKALKVTGVYDASVPTLGRLFSEGDNNSLFPVKNWQAFSEKQGLKGAIDIVDLDPIARALKESYMAFEQIKGQVYEITGISDIIRGQSEASETATAQQLKGQFASLKLKSYQSEVARFATDLLQLMAQVMCKKFDPKTLLQISAADQLMPQDQQMIPQAIELLVGPERLQDPNAEEGPNPLRSFRVEVNADSLIILDEKEEKEARVEFLTATGSYIEKMSQVLMATPPEAKGPVVGLLMEMLKYGVTGFKVGKNIEGAFDETAEQLKQLANQPPPPPQEPPEVQVEKIKAQMEDQKSQREDAREREKMQAELQFKAAEHQQNMQFEREKHQQTMEQQNQQFQAKLYTDAALTEAKVSSDREMEGKRIEASKEPKVAIDGTKELNGVASTIKDTATAQTQAMSQAMEQFGKGLEALAMAIGEMKTVAKVMAAPRRLRKDPGTGEKFSEPVVT